MLRTSPQPRGTFLYRSLFSEFFGFGYIDSITFMILVALCKFYVRMWAVKMWLYRVTSFTKQLILCSSRNNKAGKDDAVPRN